MRIVFCLFLIFLTGCASKQVREPIAFGQVKIFDVLCESKNQKGFEGFTDMEILYLSQSRIILSDKQKKEKEIDAKTCILEGVNRLTAKPDGLKGAPFYEANCTLGGLNFRDKYLQVIDNEKHSYTFRRHDGKIWILPKNLCQVSEIVEEQN